MCDGGEDPPRDTSCRYKQQHVEGCCVRGFDTATLLSVKTTSNLRGMVREKVDSFDIGGATFDLTGSDLVSSSCRECRLRKASRTLRQT